MFDRGNLGFASQIQVQRWPKRGELVENGSLAPSMGAALLASVWGRRVASHERRHYGATIAQDSAAAARLASAFSARRDPPRPAPAMDDLGAPFDSLEELAEGSRASLDGDSASVASADRPAPSPAEMKRDRIGAAADDGGAGVPTVASPTPLAGAAVALRRQAPPDRRRAVGKPPPEDRTGFARIYFENQNFTSSTVFKLYGNTTVLEVRKSMANKIKIPLSDFEYYVIVVVFPTDCTSVAALLTDATPGLTSLFTPNSIALGADAAR